MSNKLIHWANVDSVEEAAIKKACKSIGIDDKKGAAILDGVFRTYRSAFKDPRVPEILITDFLRAIPNINKVRWAITNMVLQVRAGLRPIESFKHKYFRLHEVYKRLLNQRRISKDDRNTSQLHWKNNMLKVIEEETAIRNQVLIESGRQAYALTPERYTKYLRLRRTLIYKSILRAKKFREAKRDEQDNQ